MYFPAAAVTQALDESVHGVAPAASDVPSGPNRSVSPAPTSVAAAAITAMRLLDIPASNLSELRRCSTQAPRLLPRRRSYDHEVARPARSVDDVLAVYERWGDRRHKQQVPQLAHALQTAAHAREAAA